MELKRRASLLKLGSLALLVTAIAFLLYLELTREGFSAPAPEEEMAQRRAAFEREYEAAVWGKNSEGKGSSGYGSTLEFTRLYRVFLQDFLAANHVRSVVDAGCGDWEFTQTIDWKGIDYLGVDIVPSVIEADQRHFGKPNVRFAVADIVRSELPPADLLIVKDVLQHLSNADISRFLVQLPRYRDVLIVNDVDPWTLTAKAADIGSGGYRPLDVTAPPFSLPGTKVLVWRYGPYTKLVVHIHRAT
jgi:SAM-dependent methyltransferase